MSDLQRVAAGERCRLGDIYWLVRCGQRVPRRAWPAAAAVAHVVEGYSPVLSLGQALEEVGMGETLSDGA